MGIVREPIDIDFVVDPRPLTKAEEQAISEFIRADKEKRKQKNVSKVQSKKQLATPNSV